MPANIPPGIIELIIQFSAHGLSQRAISRNTGMSQGHSGETDEANCSWLHPVWPPPKRPDQDITFCVVSRASTERIFCIHWDFDVRNNVHKPRRLVCEYCPDISAWKSRVMKPTVLGDEANFWGAFAWDEANWVGQHSHESGPNGPATWAGPYGPSKWYGILRYAAVIYGIGTDRFVSGVIIIQVIFHRPFSQQSYAIMYAYLFVRSINLSVIIYMRIYASVI